MALLESYWKNFRKENTVEVVKKQRKKSLKIGRSGYVVDVYLENGFYQGSFNGIKVASKFIGMAEDTLRKKINNNEVYKGYVFKFRNNQKIITKSPKMKRG